MQGLDSIINSESDCKSPQSNTNSVNSSIISETSQLSDASFNIEISGNISLESSKHIMELINECLGCASLKITVSKLSRAAESCIERKKKILENDLEISIENYNANQDRCDNSEEVQPVFLNHSNNEGGDTKFFTRTFEFEKAYELIVVEACSEIAKKIHLYADSSHVSLDIIPKGYKLTAQNESDLDVVENGIKAEYNSIKVIKLNHPKKEIKSLVGAIEGIRSDLMEVFNLNRFYIMTAGDYHKAYRKISRKSLDLTQKPQQKSSKKSNLKLIFVKKDIKVDREFSLNLETIMNTKIKVYEAEFQFKTSSALTSRLIRKMENLVSNTRFHFSYEIDKDDLATELHKTNSIKLALKAHCSYGLGEEILNKEATILQDSLSKIFSCEEHSRKFRDSAKNKEFDGQCSFHNATIEQKENLSKADEDLDSKQNRSIESRAASTRT